MKKTNCFFLCLFFLLASCSSKPGAVHTGKPDWFYKPSAGGKIGGIGIAGEHVSGLNAQKSLAIERAIDDIAKQLGVEVKQITTVTSVGNQDTVRTEIATYSIQTVNGEVVKAVIMEFWEDPESSKLYVWMVVK